MNFFFPQQKRKNEPLPSSKTPNKSFLIFKKAKLICFPHKTPGIDALAHKNPQRIKNFIRQTPRTNSLSNANKQEQTNFPTKTPK